LLTLKLPVTPISKPSHTPPLLCSQQAWLVLGGATDPDLLHTAALAHLHAWLALRQAEQLRPATATPAALNAVMAMLGAAAEVATKLADGGRNVAQIEASMAAARGLAEQAALRRELRRASRQTLLLPGGGGSRWPESVELPGGALPPAAGRGSQAVEGLEAARDRAARALGALPLFPDGCSFERALQIWRSQAGTSDAEVQHRVQEAERLLLPRVVALAEGGAAAEAAWLLSTQEVEALEALVDAYTAGLAGLLRQPAVLASAELVELKSRGVLMVRPWQAALCVGFL
jgi:hypothetical protein